MNSVERANRTMSDMVGAARRVVGSFVLSDSLIERMIRAALQAQKEARGEITPEDARL